MKQTSWRVDTEEDEEDRGGQTGWISGGIALLGLPSQNATDRGLQPQALSSHGSGGWKAKVKGASGLVSPKASPQLAESLPSRCFPRGPLVCVYSPGLIRTPVLWDQGPT